VRHAGRNEVARVVVDGATVTYQLRPNAQWLRALPREYQQSSQRFTLTTVRPSDYQAPYATLLANQVPFSAVDKKAGGLLGSLLVRTP
jgi:ABC-type oligopeptide transport system substrate-binding subunit